MTGRRTISVWRWLASWAVAYALAVHTILVGFAGLPAPVAASAADSVFEICHTAPSSSTKSDTERGAPDRHASDHCKNCVMGGAAFVPPPPVAALWSFDPVGRRIQHAAANERPASPETYREQARGPPAHA